ncbi:glycoside hydrolase family 5 protein [Marinimicrobium alkaliphilum]|uniref:glycoside hydrolase family 5 protein n=1 Tax=Marinimicrobium alkaliphilum TaxID=2202654 RepID=UPI000DB908C8|nr:glycoside hydrolase family 5 protein [Marinimicrobium alkaliphilum]
MNNAPSLARLGAALTLTLLVACGGNNQPDNDLTPPTDQNNGSASTSSASSNSSASSAPSDAQIPLVENCRFEFTERALPDELPGFHVEGTQLLDGNGNPFIMRGVNYPYAWYRQRDTAQDFSDIAATCANSVRVVLANGEQWNRVNGEELSAIINWLRERQMIAILEVHDATGWPENNSAAHPDTAVDYWLSDDIRAAIDGTENHVIINIANEPLGNFYNEEADRNRSEWIDYHTRAIERLRAAGLPHTLIVDAPNWGQDWTNSMRDGDAAQQVFDADPDGNVVFSIHMYHVYDSRARIQAYFEAFAEKELPLIVGEFAADHAGDGNVVEDAILDFAEVYGAGYLGWSWSGNSSHLVSLDIVLDFDPDKLSDWGLRLIHGDDGIAQTSELCTCFE